MALWVAVPISAASLIRSFHSGCTRANRPRSAQRCAVSNHDCRNQMFPVSSTITQRVSHRFREAISEDRGTVARG